MNPEIAERTRNVIAKHLRVPVEQVSLDATFEQLGMDSLDSVNLLFEIEDEFDISIEDRDAKSIASVQQMIEGIETLVERKKADAQATPPAK